MTDGSSGKAAVDEKLTSFDTFFTDDEFVFLPRRGRGRPRGSKNRSLGSFRNPYFEHPMTVPAGIFGNLLPKPSSSRASRSSSSVDRITSPDREVKTEPVSDEDRTPENEDRLMETWDRVPKNEDQLPGSSDQLKDRMNDQMPENEDRIPGSSDQMNDCVPENTEPENSEITGKEEEEVWSDNDEVARGKNSTARPVIYDHFYTRLYLGGTRNFRDRRIPVPNNQLEPPDNARTTGSKYGCPDRENCFFHVSDDVKSFLDELDPAIVKVNEIYSTNAITVTIYVV